MSVPVILFIVKNGDQTVTLMLVGEWKTMNVLDFGHMKVLWYYVNVYYV